MCFQVLSLFLIIYHGRMRADAAGGIVVWQKERGGQHEQTGDGHRRLTHRS